jgi:hypothetical protein
MDWTALKPVAGKLAHIGLPTLGKLLGDVAPFPGGSMLGEMLGSWAGNAIANALGVPATPEDVGAAIQQLPPGELQARLAPVESEAAAKWEAIAKIEEARAADRTAQSQAINTSIREEVAQGVSWWHWRHLLGYLVLLYGLEQVIAIAYAMFGKGISPADLAALFNATAVFTAGLFALLGYVAQDTSNTKIAALTGEKPEGIIVATAKAIGAKKTK